MTRFADAGARAHSGCLAHQRCASPTRLSSPPALPDASLVETLYEVRVTCKGRATNHLRALLPSTISRLPVTLQCIHGEIDEVDDESHIQAEMTTAGRNNEAMEQVVPRLLIDDDVRDFSWSIVKLRWSNALRQRRKASTPQPAHI